MNEQDKERYAQALACLLPRRIVKHCAIRVAANATSGRWGSESMPDLKFMDAIDRWAVDEWERRRS